tara:strand:- start:49 stop:594 length:546 start_codon:yes stop_codon:yes gene_type:complete
MNFIQKNKIISIKNFYFLDNNERESITHELENNYKKHFRLKTGYTLPIVEYNNNFFDNLYDKFLKKSYEIFGNFELSNLNSRRCWCFKSSKNNFERCWHNHITTSTINGVYYYQIQDGDSISFLDKDGIEFQYFPSQFELLIFPNHLMHTPNDPISADKNRYSINVEIRTKETSEELFSEI